MKPGFETNGNSDGSSTPQLPQPGPESLIPPPASGESPPSICTDQSPSSLNPSPSTMATRIPAACNGVVGFKQGLGVVPQEYAQDGFGNISYITPMTRTGVMRICSLIRCLPVTSGGLHFPISNAPQRTLKRSQNITHSILWQEEYVKQGDGGNDECRKPNDEGRPKHQGRRPKRAVAEP